MTVRVNTITRWMVKGSPNVDWKHAVNSPRSIVTDHYLLDQCFQALSIYRSWKWEDNVAWLVLLIIVSVSTHQRPNLASGISLYVSDDPRGSNVCVTSPRRVLWSRGADGNMNLWPIGLGRYARHALGIIPGETYREPQASSVMPV